MAVVSGFTGANDRNRAGGISGDGRSLRVSALHWTFLHGGVGNLRRRERKLREQETCCCGIGADAGCFRSAGGTASGNLEKLRGFVESYATGHGRKLCRARFAGGSVVGSGSIPGGLLAVSILGEDFSRRHARARGTSGVRTGARRCQSSDRALQQCVATCRGTKHSSDGIRKSGINLPRAARLHSVSGKLRIGEI